MGFSPDVITGKMNYPTASSTLHSVGQHGTDIIAGYFSLLQVLAGFALCEVLIPAALS